MLPKTKAHRTKLEAEVTPLPGAICLQYVRCGKSNCWCARRGRKHKAYYRFWREECVLRKAYIKRADLKLTRKACREWREQQAELRERARPEKEKEPKSRPRMGLLRRLKRWDL